MKTFGAAVVTLFSLALCQGGVITSFKEVVEKELDEIVDPLMAEVESLMERLNHEAIRKAANVQYFSADSIYKMDMDACSDLALSLELGGEVAWNATITAYTLGSKVTSDVWGLVNCPQINPIKAVKCLTGDLSEIKSLVLSAKPMFLKYKAEVGQMTSLIEQQYTKCVGKASAGLKLPWETSPDTKEPKKKHLGLF